MPETSKQCPGLFVIDLDGTKIGMTTLDRREAEHPGHVRPDAGEAELTTCSYRRRRDAARPPRRAQGTRLVCGSG